MGCLVVAANLLAGCGGDNSGKSAARELCEHAPPSRESVDDCIRTTNAAMRDLNGAALDCGYKRAGNRRRDHAKLYRLTATGTLHNRTPTAITARVTVSWERRGKPARTYRIGPRTARHIDISVVDTHVRQLPGGLPGGGGCGASSTVSYG